MINLSKIASALLFILLLGGVAWAQDEGAITGEPQLSGSADDAGSLVFSSEATEIVPTELIILRVVEDELREIYKEDLFEAPDFPSLLFLPDEYATLTAARASFVKSEPDEDAGTDAGAGEGPDGSALPAEVLEKFEREIKLGGILFLGSENWIVWINNKRITPKALPDEVVSIKVSKEYVELKWHDEKTNTIVPVRLRPNQRFNLDARMFLPG